jgi:hypothetical protein
MRCISPHGGYSIQVIEGNEQIVVDARGFAQSVVIGKAVIANFQRGGLMDHEIEAALEAFNFSGVPEGVNPLTRISVFDTEGFVQQYPEDRQDEMLIQIDKRLRQLQVLHPTEFVIVESPVAAKPWPSYDNDSAEDILKIVERLQMEPEGIRLYEVEHENREEIVRAMLEKENPEYAAQLYGDAETPAAPAPAAAQPPEGEIIVGA